MSDNKVLIGDMDRKTCIEILKRLLEAMEVFDGISPSPERINALKMAIASLETDEAYQLEYEKPEVCEDCISREAALRINELHHGQMPNHINHQIWKELKAVPPVLPKAKKGHWIKEDRGRVEYSAVCSECGDSTFWSEKSNFCPNCGAKMQEVGE